MSTLLLNDVQQRHKEIMVEILDKHFTHFIGFELLRTAKTYGFLKLSLHYDHMIRANPAIEQIFDRNPETAYNLLRLSVLEIAEKKGYQMPYSSLGLNLTRSTTTEDSLPQQYPHSSNLNKLQWIRGIIFNLSSQKVLPQRITSRCNSCHAERVVEHLDDIFKNFSRIRKCSKLIDLKPCDSTDITSRVINCRGMRFADFSFCNLSGIDQLHRSKLKVYLEDSTCSGLRVGDEVDLLGFYRTGKKQKSYIFRCLGFCSPRDRVSDTDFSQVLTLSGRSRISWCKDQVAPSIFGYDLIKEAIALMFCSGTERVSPDFRETIHILLLGAPGVAKSQFLKFAQKILPQSKFTSGRSSTGAGLTVTVVTNAYETRLEMGAILSAGNGLICIDEIDKMDEISRSSISEAIDTRSITFAKAGLVTEFKSNCSFLAAGNVLRRDDHTTNMSSALLDRFDLIFMIDDKPNYQTDLAVARQIISIHNGSHLVDEADYGLDDLREFLKQTRAQERPIIPEHIKKDICIRYADMRRDLSQVPPKLVIKPRLAKTIERVAIAYAKVELNPYVNQTHVDKAITLVKNSTIDAYRRLNNPQSLAARN